MKRKQSIWVLAAVAAAVMPLAAFSQIAPEKAPGRTGTENYKYKAFVGWGYTSLNQVNQSNSGLQGVSLSLTRDWGKYFGVTVDGGHYAWTVTRANPQSASVDLYLAGPEVHADLYERIGIFVHGLIGAAHTGGVSIRPNESFAGGVGLGLDYKLGPHLGLRLSGDDIGSSFTLVPFQPGDSPHRQFNARAAFGVTYKF
ncbi:MAG TPA: hypothetical protein VHZ28_02365 [Terracidiphilus sp.]|nr:hypothetical protein [Terracidiphilus sp.]HEX4283907.1 hypothetical protein [Terracidiphilus sp.]